VQELAEVYPLKVFPDALGLSPLGARPSPYGRMVFTASAAAHAVR